MCTVKFDTNQNIAKSLTQNQSQSWSCVRHKMTVLMVKIYWVSIRVCSFIQRLFSTLRHEQKNRNEESVYHPHRPL
ncbi:MAG: hypothetical protein RIQ62_828 [Bacteroidota bacterium]|jgi:hypothetical protein